MIGRLQKANLGINDLAINSRKKGRRWKKLRVDKPARRAFRYREGICITNPQYRRKVFSVGIVCLTEASRFHGQKLASRIALACLDIVELLIVEETGEIDLSHVSMKATTVSVC